MHFHNTFVSVLLASSSTALTTPKRENPILVADILAIDAGVKALTANVETYTSGAFPTGIANGIPILFDVVAIHVANRKGYADAVVSPTLSSADSTAVVNSVSDTVAIDIPASIEVLKAKKPQFQSAGLDLVVLASLDLLKYDHDTFSAAVLTKLTVDSTELAQANAGVAVIDAALQDGINYFS